MIDGLAQLPLEFSPGEAWNYSVSTDVLGYLVGKISGKPFEQFLKERIFDPLGMVDTGFHVPADKAHRFAACYSADGKGGKVLQDDPAKSPYLKPPAFVSGGGGLVSTTADYLKFCRMLLGRGALGSARLLSPKTLALMTTNHLPGNKTLPELSRSLFSEATYDGVGFGLGFAVTHGSRADADPRQRRRVLVGRRGDDVVLGRSGRRSCRRVHDAEPAVGRLSGSPRAAHAGLLGDHREQFVRTVVPAKAGTHTPQQT